MRPGNILVREWDRQSQRVIVMPDGFAWNGQTYDSLSKVAFAITGTRWNGPVSTLKVCGRGGKACCKNRHPIICRHLPCAEAAAVIGDRDHEDVPKDV